MSTSGVFTSNLRDPMMINPSFTGSVAKYMPRGSAPISAMLSYIQRGEAMKDTFLRWQFKYFEHPNFTLVDAMPSGQKDGNGILKIKINAGFPVENDVYFNLETHEHILVIGVNGSDQIVVRRAQGGQPLAAAAGTTWIRHSTAFEEASLRPAAQHHTGFDWGDNVSQIFRNGWARSGTMAQILTQAIAQDVEVKESLMGANKAQMMQNHTIDREMAILFGRRAETTLRGQPLRKMSGIWELIERYAPQNIVVAPNGVLSYNRFEEMIDPMFDQVTDPMEMNDRVLIGTSHITKMINQMGRIYNEKVLTTSESTHFGMSYKTFETDRGKFKVIEHPLLNHFANVSPSLRGTALIMDLSSLRTHFLGNRDGVYNEYSGTKNGQVSTDAGVDAEGGSILSEMSLGTMAPHANGILMNWCDVARDVYSDLAVVPKACFSISKPARAGGVVVGEVITIDISGAVPSQNLQVLTPTGVVDVTINASGVGSANYTIQNQADYIYEFSLVMGTAAVQRQWNEVATTAARTRTTISGTFPFNNTLSVPSVPDSLNACDADGQGTAPGPLSC